MSFTEDELESFSTILEQRLLAHRHEMERAFDERITEYRRETEQRLFQMQQENLRTLILKLTEFQGHFDAAIGEKLTMQQSRLAQTMSSELEGQRHFLESMLDQKLEHLQQGIEQQLDQHVQQLILTAYDAANLPNGHQFEAIEVQTELPWEDLVDVVGKALDERLAKLQEQLQQALKAMEQALSTLLQQIQAGVERNHLQPITVQAQSATTDVLVQGVEHIERVLESLQVVMTANHALLSDRMFTHQQLPLERAHPAGHALSRQENGASERMTQPPEHAISTFDV